VQFFMATLTVVADGRAVAATRSIFVAVPPKL
jgi:hypothetical protein